jgi:hypothetical protein
MTSPDHKRDVTVRVQLRDKGFYWPLFRVANVAELAATIAMFDAEARLAEQARLADEAARAAPESNLTEDLPATFDEPLTETREVTTTVGYRDRKYKVAGYVAFDRANLTFHVFGCRSVTRDMQKVHLRTLQSQNIPRNPDCANLPLPYEERIEKEPIIQTTTEVVPR